MFIAAVIFCRMLAFSIGVILFVAVITSTGTFTAGGAAASYTDFRSGACTRVISCCELCSAALVGIG